MRGFTGRLHPPPGPASCVGTNRGHLDLKAGQPETQRPPPRLSEIATEAAGEVGQLELVQVHQNDAVVQPLE
eukprot:1212912-Prymnesium_polylepis.3